MKGKIPGDPYILFSFVNMMLRDRYDSLEDLCNDYDADADDITKKLQAAGFEYNRDANQFR